MKNKTKTKYIINVHFQDNTVKHFIRYFKGDFKLESFYKKINQKYGAENIQMISA